MKKPVFPALVLLVLLVSLVGGCGKTAVPTTVSSLPPLSTASDEGFAIYMTRYTIPVSEMHLLDHYYLAPQPFIAQSDIVSYQWASHIVTLTPAAYGKIQDLQVPTSGLSFVACVDGQPVYWGAFWTLLSSQSFDGVTIMQWPTPDPELPADAVKISMGYPGPDYSQGTDPRSDARIKEALEKAGKLVLPTAVDAEHTAPPDSATLP